MKRRRKLLAILVVGLVVAVVIGSCVMDVDLPEVGVVEDGDTGQPLKDVLASVQVYQTDFHHTKFLALHEAATHSSGMYLLWPNVQIGPVFSFFFKERTFFRPGFFLAGPTRDWHYRTRLYRMRHFLNFRYYLSSTSPKPPVFEHSVACRREIDKLKTLTLTPLDEEGVFMRLPGRRISRMYVKTDLALGKSKPSKYVRPETPYPWRNPVYYVFDQVAQEWLIIDSRAKTVKTAGPELPEWEFSAYSSEDRSIIYADRNSVFYSVSDSPLIMRDASVDEAIMHIHPQKGGISGMAGSGLNFLTIEGNGTFLCHYGLRSTGKLSHKSAGGKEPTALYGSKCFTCGDFPDSPQEDLQKDCRFACVASDGVIDLVCMRTSDRWYLYKFSPYHPSSRPEMQPWIRRVGSFAASRGISAIAVAHRPYREAAVYIAFENEGIRKFRFPWKPEQHLEEETEFFNRSKQVIKSRVTSLTVASAVNVPAVYATIGDDRILRFALDGTPDYLVKWTQNSPEDSH